jgi:hypothetical protein
MFEHLDTVIEFGALMLAASLVITAGTQLVISLLGLRGANLRSSLGDLLENSSSDRDARRYGRVIAHRVLRHPLVSDSAFSRFAIRIEKLPFVPADAAGKLRWAGSEIPLQPWLLGAVGGFFLWPATLAILDRLTPLDLSGFSALIVRYIPFLDLYGHPWRSGMLLGAVLGGLLSRWRLATSIRLDEMLSVLDKLSAPPDGTLPDPAQRAMLVIAGERRSRPRPNSKPISAQVDKIMHDSGEEGEGGVALATSVEKALAQDSAGQAQPDPRLVGLAMWFDRVMERASQRLTLQARVITVVLSCLLVFGAHLDAVRLFQSLSSSAQSRAQLAASADAMIKQAEQLPRGKEGTAAKEGARTSVPDVYRNAMAAVLALPPAPAEPGSRPKARGVSHSSATKTSGSVQSLANAAFNETNDSQESATLVSAQAGGEQVAPAVEASTKERDKKAESSARSKSAAKQKEQEKTASALKEDSGTIAAKVRAEKALETRPGFADREDAVLWLRATLDGDPALENLSAAYEQEVNTELSSDTDKLLDHSASIKGELSRSQVRLVPQEWTGWTPNARELPGLLISVVFLSLGAALCYNGLKSLASLRPMPAVRRYE